MTTAWDRSARAWRTRPYLWLIAVVVVASCVGLAATAAQPSPARATPAVTAPVVGTTVACPGLRSRAGYTDSTVAAATPPQRGASKTDAAPPTGRAVVRTLTTRPSDAKTLISLTTPGQRGTYVGRNGERDFVVGRGVDALAPGFSVTQTERTVDGTGRGIASTQCLPTGSDFWFVGASSGVGQRATLVLTNPENATASVDVDFYGRRGPLDAPAARGIQVQPRSAKEIPIATVVPAQPVLAMHVSVTVGRLSAALTQTDVSGLSPLGTDWIASTLAPSTSVIVAGFPPVARGRVASQNLDVAVPGNTDAVVSVQVSSADGTFTPSGGGVLDVRGGSVARFSIDRYLRGQPATVLLTSDQPIVAAAKVVLRRPGGLGDSLYLSATMPFVSTAVVPDNRTTSDLVTRLILTAPSTSASLTVTAFDGQRSKDSTVNVAAGTTRMVTVSDPTKPAGFGLLISPVPGSGPIVGVRFLDEEGSRGPLVSALPLRPARLTALIRQAYPITDAGMASHSS